MRFVPPSISYLYLYVYETLTLPDSVLQIVDLMCVFEWLKGYCRFAEIPMRLNYIYLILKLYIVYLLNTI